MKLKYVWGALGALGLAMSAAVPVAIAEPFYDGSRKAKDLPWWEVSQNWDMDTKKAFWFTSQGSRLMPYTWFLYLEQENSQELFRSDANFAKYGYVPSPADRRYNPDGLPIGIAKGSKDDQGRTWMGPTCSLCHTSFIKSPDGTPILIDGGQTMGDFQGFLDDLVNALIANWSDEAKFKRVAANILGKPGTVAKNEQQLQNAMQEWTMWLASVNDANTNAGKVAPYGYGRVDAVGAIFNMVMHDIAAPDNLMPADAPVSFPFLWGTPQSTVVQWPGFAPNNLGGAGALIRNIGEVVGVFGRIGVKNKSGERFLQAEGGDTNIYANDSNAWLGYPSSVDINNLGKMENWLHDLRSPKWPENLMGKIDQDAADRGRLLYFDPSFGCATCHEVVARDKQSETYQPVMVPQKQILTDPQELINMGMTANKYGVPWVTGKLKGTNTLVAPINLFGVNPTFGQTVEVRTNLLLTTGLGIALNQPFSSIVGAANSFVKNNGSFKQFPDSYKARPLTGIWATAPYLHNGSVPTLFDLLKPSDERPTTFKLGSHTLDTKKVGYVNEGAYTFDTTEVGNSNKGHEYGTAKMSDQDRYDLVEFLKTL